MGIENVKPFSEDASKILNKAKQLAQKNYHNWCGTPHLFLATISFLLNEKEDVTKYNEIFTKIQNILAEYNISGKTFQAQFLISAPKGPEPEEGEEFKIHPDSEYTKIISTLKQRVLKEKRPMDVIDLILELFSDGAFTVFQIMSAITGSDKITSEMREKVIKAFKSISNPLIKELEKLPELTNLNKWLQEKPQHVVGVHENIDQLCMALNGQSIKNAILTGPAGTGKTTIVYEFVQRINNGTIVEGLQDKIVYQLDPSALIAGCRYRGDFEEKLMNILEIVKQHPELILFIDEGHMIVKLGDSSDDGANNMGNILKPYITRGEIQLILATTSEEYTKHIMPQKAFARRFHEIKVKEPTRAETKEILEGLKLKKEEYFGHPISDEIIEEVLDVAEKYTLDQANPAKSINAMELACAHAKTFCQEGTPVTLNNVIESIRLKFGIYVSKTKVQDTEEELTKEILGQEECIKQIVNNLHLVDKGLYEKDKPMFSMLFAGSTGTGKTETAKIIAEKFFGSKETNLIKINCGEFSTETDVTKLTGSSAGYVGYDDEPALISQVRKYPQSIIVFDEVEKAHKSIWKVLLNILDCGEMNDNKGNKVSFRNTVIVFTTNLGCTNKTGKAQGMGLVKTEAKADQKEIMAAIENYFSPEFLGRLDDIVFFNSLSKDIIKKLIQRYKEEFEKLSKLSVEFTEDDIEEIIKEAKIETAGARGVKKAVKKQILKAELRK